MTPLISVLIPLYQSEKYLPRCLDSVLAQTYPNLEICLADDGSTDHGAESAKNWAEKTGFPTAVRQYPHLGVSHTRQKLVESARGEYLFFLDSDDYLDPRTIEILYRLAEEHSAGIVQCAIERTKENALPPVDCSNPTVQVFPSRAQGVASYLSAQGPLRCMLAAKLYHRSVLEGIRFPLGKIHEDEATMHRIVGNAQGIVTTSLPLYHYFTNPDSITKRRFSYARYDILDANLDKIRYCREQGMEAYAHINSLYYCLNCLNLYRLTHQELGSGDSHLPQLLEKYRQMTESFLASGLAGADLRDQLRGWMDDPLQGELPRFWDLVPELLANAETYEKEN